MLLNIARMTSQDFTWTQTLFTVTPEEDGMLREFHDTAIVSADPEVPLLLGSDHIIRRVPLTSTEFVPPEIPPPKAVFNVNAEIQTLLEGIPFVRISGGYKDTASQTTYMSSPCPPLEYFKDIMTSMQDVSVPTLKNSTGTNTIVSFPPDTLLHTVIDELGKDTTDEEYDEFVSDSSEDEADAEMEIPDILHYLIARAMWIIDPSSQAPQQTNDIETQTSIIFNWRTRIIVMDSETQTTLTCEPKESNTTLLANYQETKNLILEFLEDCLENGVETRMMIDDIVDEIIDKCADLVRFPMKDQIAQTVASYKSHEEKNAVLRKLKLEVIVDPLEASIIVVPLMDNLLQLVCDIVSENESTAIKNILDTILQRTMVLVQKRMDIQKELQPKPMDEIFEQRRKKILKLMLKKSVETVSTQTGIAGVPEITRYKESKDVVCSVCREQSTCHWCLADQEGETVQSQPIQTLRTQDILLAYKPCYIVTTPSEKKKNPYLQPPCPPIRKVERIPTPPVYSSSRSTDESHETVDVLVQPEKSVKTKGSVSGWSYILDSAFMKPWSVQESMSSRSKTTTLSSEKSTTKSAKKQTCRTQSGLASQAAKALEVLKNTFCTQETCTASSLETLKDNSSDEDDWLCNKSTSDTSSTKNNIPLNQTRKRGVFCTPQTCKAIAKSRLSKNQRQRKQSTEGDVSEVPSETRDDGFKIIPICTSYDPDSLK